MSLPPEIVSHIFRYYASRPRWEWDADWRCPASLILLHICSTWRTIGLAESSLWTTLHLRFDEYYERVDEIHRPTPTQIENFVTSWVSRARDRPITLTIDGDMVGCLGYARSLALVTQLAPHLLPFPSNSIRWPILESVEVMSADNFHVINHMFSFAPKLQAISDHRGVLSPSLGTVPWEQITDYHGKLKSVLDGIKILEQAENFENCSFYLTVVADELDDAPDTVSHLHLRELLLEGAFEIILPILTLPALRTFELRALPEDAHTIAGFLERHSWHLRQLRISHTLVTSLPQMPYYGVPTVVHNELFELLPNTDFLPSLQHLHLDRFRSQERADYETMARALTTRWQNSNGPAILRSFVLWINLANDELIGDFEELLSPVKALTAAGVNISVTIGGGNWWESSDGESSGEWRK
ncbi:hypothetical protein B0H19DRAFT_1342373 [Mycena capillaripes]|nr:hypothetical protein B0H19DRAFT_1342373 [Mycena capillaripes]